MGADFTEQLVALVTAHEGERPRRALDAYFGRVEGIPFTGSQFELVAEITARDLVVVSMFGIDVPPRPARWLLSDEGRATDACWRRYP